MIMRYIYITLSLLFKISVGEHSVTYFHYISEPKTFTDAQAYCQAYYGTDLATIISDDDRKAAISEVGSSTSVWIGLSSVTETGFWEYFSGITCPLSIYGSCVDFWLHDNGYGNAPRCLTGKDEECGFDCAQFYSLSNGIDNNVECDEMRPFLCDKCLCNRQSGDEYNSRAEDKNTDIIHANQRSNKKSIKKKT
eukprot:316863_1